MKKVHSVSHEWCIYTVLPTICPFVHSVSQGQSIPPTVHMASSMLMKPCFFFVFDADLFIKSVCRVVAIHEWRVDNTWGSGGGHQCIRPCDKRWLLAQTAWERGSTRELTMAYARDVCELACEEDITCTIHGIETSMRRLRAHHWTRPYGWCEFSACCQIWCFSLTACGEGGGVQCYLIMCQETTIMDGSWGRGLCCSHFFRECTLLPRKL